MHDLLGKEVFKLQSIRCQGIIIPKRHGLLSHLFTANGLIQRFYIKYFQCEI